MGWTEETVKQLDKYIDKDIKEWGEWMYNYLNKDMAAEMDKVHRRENGIGIDFQDI